MTPAFLTGSRAYGKPKEHSDFDIVVRMDQCVIKALSVIIENYLGDHQIIPAAIGTKRIRFISPIGPIDFIICESDKTYELWRIGTDMLIGEAPVTKQRAIEVFDNLAKDDAEKFIKAQDDYYNATYTSPDAVD